MIDILCQQSTPCQFSRVPTINIMSIQPCVRLILLYSSNDHGIVEDSQSQIGLNTGVIYLVIQCRYALDVTGTVHYMHADDHLTKILGNA